MKIIELYRNEEKVREKIFVKSQEAKTLFGQWIHDIAPLLTKHTFYIKIYESETEPEGIHEGVYGQLSQKSTLPGLHAGSDEKN